MPNYSTDKVTGKFGEDFFEQNYLIKNNIPYLPATRDEQKLGWDFINTQKNVTYEVKNTLKRTDEIIVEEMYDIDRGINGWIYTSQANIFCFVNIKKKQMILVKGNALRESYKKYGNKLQLKENEITDGERGDKFKGSFRRIPLMALDENDYKIVKL